MLPSGQALMTGKKRVDFGEKGLTLTKNVGWEGTEKREGETCINTGLTL